MNFMLELSLFSSVWQPDLSAHTPFWLILAVSAWQ